jgi:hypothetical protein
MPFLTSLDQWKGKWPWRFPPNSAVIDSFLPYSPAQKHLLREAIPKSANHLNHVFLFVPTEFSLYTFIEPFSFCLRAHCLLPCVSCQRSKALSYSALRPHPANAEPCPRRTLSTVMKLHERWFQWNTELWWPSILFHLIPHLLSPLTPASIENYLLLVNQHWPVRTGMRNRGRVEANLDHELKVISLWL